MSNRNDILDRMVSALENITITNSFENTVNEVERKFLYVDQVKSFPKLMVLGGDEVFDDTDRTHTISFFDIRIIGFTKNKKEPEVALCSLLSDVLKIVNSSTYNSDYEKMTPKRVETDEGLLHESGEGFAMFILTVECVYRWLRSTP